MIQSLYNKNAVTIIAGPCAVENEHQTQSVAQFISKCGLTWFRAGTFKPRTSPYSFQGLGMKGLEILRGVSDAYNLLCISELVSETYIDAFVSNCDAIQIGARNMTNFEFLKALSEDAHKSLPILFKRGYASTIKEWICAAEYLCPDKNKNIMLCERGIRTFENATRFTLDISSVPIVKMQSNFPVCVDVSHSAGKVALVPSLAKAAIAAGADALMVEVHPDPRNAKSDNGQQLNFDEFRHLISELRPIASALGKILI